MRQEGAEWRQMLVDEVGGEVEGCARDFLSMGLDEICIRVWWESIQFHETGHCIK